jgi:hypothetical protein
MDVFGVPLIALAAIAPVVAVVSGLLWARSPRLQRDAVVRGALIVAVSLTAIEALVGALIVGFVLLLAGWNDF